MDGNGPAVLHERALGAGLESALVLPKSEPAIPEPHLEEVLRADASGVRTVTGSALWKEITAGNRKIVLNHLSDERCYLVMCERRAEEHDSTRQSRSLHLLKQVLAANAQKPVALDLRMSPSMVASMLKQYLTALGFPCQPSKVPIALMMLAQTAASEPAISWRQSEFSQDGNRYVVASAARPDLAFKRLLSPAQYEVMRLLIEGHTYAEIADVRRTSVRTVANQLGSTFRRLHVSGRLQLCNHVVVLGAEQHG
jgi:DNA-binding CsgD family transcriptional regulator